MPTAVVIVVNRFPVILARLPGAVDAIVEAVAHRIEEEARATAPILQPGTYVSDASPRYPGQLRDSIRAYRVGNEHWRVEAQEQDYAAYEEYGSVNNPPQPYMTPSAHHQEPGLIDAIRAAIGVI